MALRVLKHRQFRTRHMNKTEATIVIKTMRIKEPRVGVGGVGETPVGRSNGPSLSERVGGTPR